MCLVFIFVRVQDSRTKQHCLFEVLPQSAKSNANERSTESNNKLFEVWTQVEHFSHCQIISIQQLPKLILTNEIIGDNRN